jgi:hypothetical protein
MRNKLPIFFILFILILGACTEKVNLTLDETYTRLVVDGYIKSDTQAYQITLTKTSDYFSNVPSPKVVNAEVSLSDGSTVIPLTETEPGHSGIYTTDKKFAGKIGDKYQLNIHLQDAIAGTNDYSGSCDLLRVTHLDSIRTSFKENWGKEGYWQVLLYAQDPPGQKNYYLLNLYRNGKLWSDTINKVRISDDQFFEGNYINGIEVFLIDNSRKYETLNVGDSIRVELSAITKEYYDFITQVQQAGFNIPFFSGPPANVVGNVSNGGVGFFAAYSSSYAKTVVKK